MLVCVGAGSCACVSIGYERLHEWLRALLPVRTNAAEPPQLPPDCTSRTHYTIIHN